MTTAVRVNMDMQEGIMSRFKSMPISKSSILVGHAISAVVRSIISTLIIFGIAFVMGFQSKATGMQWIMVILILLLLCVTLF